MMKCEKTLAIRLLLLLPLLVLNPSGVSGQTPSAGNSLWMVENLGQWDARVCYRVMMHRAALFFERQAITVVVQETATEKEHLHHARGHNYHAYRMTFEGSNSAVALSGHTPDGSYENYYLGRSPSRWVTGARRYGCVYYSGLYDGVDLSVHADGQQIEYDFVVHPLADVATIGVRYDGVDGLLLRDGMLVVTTSVGEVVEQAPNTYQIVDGDTLTVACHYRLDGSTVHFDVGDYDPHLPLIIDPTLHFSTYTGSTADNWGTTATYDQNKHTYTAGLVFDIGYPTSIGAYSDHYSGNADIGIFKFDSSGSQRLFATYLGGSNADMPHSMYVNNFDELVLMGTTGSADFPTTEGAYDTSFNGGGELAYLCFYNNEYYRNIYFPEGSDLFVCHFDSDGSSLLGSTYIGGSGNDGLNYRTRYNNAVRTVMLGNDSLYYNYGDGARGELITDRLNNVYVGSTTFSADFPVSSGALQSASGGQQEGVLFKLDHHLRNLIWSTYIGGEGDDAVYSVDCDADYNVVACGGTNSPNLRVTAGALQTAYGGGSADGMVVKISSDGNRLIGATYLGSDAYDQCYFVRSGKDGDIFIYGQTCAAGSSMIHDAGYGTPNSGMLLARLSSDLQRRVWSTVFGTPDSTPNLSPTAFAVDICGRVYAAGWGRDFVNYNGIAWYTAGTWEMETTAGALQTDTDGQDFYIACLDADATALEYATFFGELHVNVDDGGGDHVDGGTSRIDKLGTLYQSVCASCGGHNGFPTTPDAWASDNGSSNCNNAIFKLNIHDDFAVAEFVTPPAGCHPYTAHLHNTGRGDHFLWDFGDGDTSTQRNPVHTFAAPGDYHVRLIAYNNDGCGTIDTAETVVMVIGEQHRREEMAVCDGERIQIGLQPQAGCDYRWTSGRVSDSTIANPYVESTGEYILLIQSADAVCSETDTFDVVFRRLVDTLIVTSPRCPGGTDGTAVAVANGSGYRYCWDGVWNDDSLLSGLSDDGQEHLLTVTDGNCSSQHAFRIDPLPRPEVSIVHTPRICTDCSGEIEAQVSGEGSWTYRWDDGMEGASRDSLCQGTYRLSIIDSNGCSYLDSVSIDLIIPEQPLQAWADDSVIFVGTSTFLHATTAADAAYRWEPADGLNHPYSNTTEATPETTTTYTVVRSDTTGCEYSVQVTIRCISISCGESLLFIPNAFTPNDDGQNDQLCLRGENISTFHIAIYSRWGEKVYSSDALDDCWDGRHNGNLCLPGVYYYTCHIQCANNESSDLKGDITLIR